MRALGLICLVLLVSVGSSDAQTVALRNVSYPGTALEVGNTVEVKIMGAAPFGTVTVIANGAGPYTFGTTDGFGNWSTTAVEESIHVGAREQYWFVNGIEMTPVNSVQFYVPFAPRLPNFTVYSNFTGTNCPGQSTVSNSCGGTNTARRWVFTPVSYWSVSSTASSSSVNAASGNWNSIQSKVSLTNSQVGQIFIYDSSDTGTQVGRTLSWGFDCHECHDHIDECSGSCLNSQAVYLVDVQLNPGNISASASHLNTSTSNLAAITVAHELGHALRLADIAAVTGRCSEAQSLMYGSASVLFGCGITAPTSCDANGINSVYPGTVRTCYPAGSNYCILPSSTCA